MTGKLIIFSAPSGAGKTTIVKKLLQKNLKLEFSISACSREKRSNEIHGKDYYFLNHEVFKQKIENNEFVEWEEVYNHQYYGTLKSELERIWEKGNHVIFDVDVVGGLNIKNLYPDNSLAIFIQPPSVIELEKRLKRRSTDNTEQINKRIAKAEHELTYANQFDEIVVNEDLENATMKAYELVRNFLGKSIN